MLTHAPKKILVISLAGIGDTLFTTPLIHELRLRFPEAQIDAFVLWAGSRDVLEANPHLNHVFQKNLLNAGKLESLRFLRELRAQRYDISLNTHPQSRVHYRMVARFIGAQIRISHEYHGLQFLDRLLINRSISQDYERHAVDNNLALLKCIGVSPQQTVHEYEVFLTESEESWAREFLSAHQLLQKRWIGFHVGSGGTKNLALRRWPRENYIALIQKLLVADSEIKILLFGGPEEEKDHEVILRETQDSRVLVAKTAGIRHAAALLKHCFAFLSVDTAMMHLAAAMNVANQFVIETPTWNKPIEPYGNPFTLIANPSVTGRNLDFYRYDGRGIHGSAGEITRQMQSVSVDAVFNALEHIVRKQL